MNRLSVQELHALLEHGGLDVVDVREPHEWLTGHLPGARLVPLAQLRADPRGSLPKDEIAFVCARGSRSLEAASIAESIGRKDVFSLDGGLAAWTTAGLELVRPEEGGKRIASPTGAGTVEEPETPNLEALVASNLRLHRQSKGWSLDDLAREAGISRSLLGQIEIGQASPSIGVVWKIAQTLEMPFSAFIATKPRSGTAVGSRATARRLLSADGRFSSRALFPLGEPSAPEFYELWLAPHSSESAEPHRPGTRENIVVTSGTLELHIAKDVRLLHPGDAIVFTADVPHRYVNPGREDCWFYLVMSYSGHA